MKKQANAICTTKVLHKYFLRGPGVSGSHTVLLFSSLKIVALCRLILTCHHLLMFFKDDLCDSGSLLVAVRRHYGPA